MLLKFKFMRKKRLDELDSFGLPRKELINGIFYWSICWVQMKMK